MLSTSGFVLALLPVPMITVFKNLGLCVTAFGDFYFFGAHHSKLIRLSILLIIIGGFSAAITDLTFTLHGYLWMITHVLIQSSYILYVRKVKKSIKIEEFEMAFYNNALSVPFFVVLCFLNSEWNGAM